VRSGSTALAKMAVAAQEERDAGLRDRLGGHTMPQWQEDTRIRLRYLAVALDFARMVKVVEIPDLANINRWYALVNERPSLSAT